LSGQVFSISVIYVVCQCQVSLTGDLIATSVTITTSLVLVAPNMKRWPG